MKPRERTLNYSSNPSVGYYETKYLMVSSVDSFSLNVFWIENERDDSVSTNSKAALCSALMHFLKIIYFSHGRARLVFV